MSQGGGNAGGGIDRLMQFADGSLLLQFACYIHWQQAMRILFHIGGIVATMDIVILPWVELLLPLDAVCTITRGGQGLDPIGIALGDESTVGDQCDRSMLQLFDGRWRWNLWEIGQWHLADDLLPRQLGEQHRRGTLRGIVVNQGVMRQPVGEIPLIGRRSEGVPSYQLQSKAEETTHIVEHVGSLSASLHDVDLAAI